jgi:NAD(P)H-nitrite reductase large subunit
MRYVILGSGAAGIAAIEAIRERDTEGEIVVVTNDPHGYYTRPGLAYYLTGELPEAMLFPFSPQDFKRMKVGWVQGTALRIDAAAHRLVYRPAGQPAEAGLAYHRLLLATGASAAPLKVPGADLPGVVKLDNLEDARGILSLVGHRLGGVKAAVVVGGGITALEIVEGLVQHKVKVHYLLRGDRYWSNVLDVSESRLVEQRLAQHGVMLHFKTELVEVLAQAGGGWLGNRQPKVGGVRTNTGEVIACGLVAGAVGVRPRLELAQASGIEAERGVLVDEFLRTSAVDVFAAGDIAQVYDPVSKKSVVDSLWGLAREQGRVAGANMAGAHEVYTRRVAFNVTRLANLTTSIIGRVALPEQEEDHDLEGGKLAIARGDSETWRELPDAIAAQSGFDVNRLRVMVGPDSLVGAVVMGDQKLSHPLFELVMRQVNICDIRERLVKGHEPAADVLAKFWEERL